MNCRPPPISPDQIEAACRADPDVFCRLKLGVRPYRFQSLILRAIADAVWQGAGRLIINVPSRHGKSMACSHWAPTWYLDNWPTRQIILGSYGQALASDFGRRVRNEFASNPDLRARLSGDSKAADSWHTTEGGRMIAVGVDGPVLGKGANLAILDDLHKDWAEGHSHAVRQHTIEWLTSTLWSRLEPNATVVIVQQRVHDEDVCGFLTQSHGDAWKVIRLPALAESNDQLGRMPGEALEPRRFTAAQLRDIRRGMDAAAWDAMFQQAPTGIGAGRLYHQFNAADHVSGTVELRAELPLHIAFDFNRNPGMHVELGQYDPTTDRFTCVHEIHGPYMKLAAALDRIAELVASLGGFKWLACEIFGDETGNQDRAETTFTCYQAIVAWLRKLGWTYRLRLPSKNPPVLDRVANVNAALRDADGEIHYAIHPRCIRLIADLKMMKEDEHGLEDKRDTALSHASSAEGYRISWLRPLQRPKPIPGAVVMLH